MSNNLPNNAALVATTISIWLYNNLSSDLVTYLANLFQIIGQNLSSMIDLQGICSDYNSSTGTTPNDNIEFNSKKN